MTSETSPDLVPPTDEGAVDFSYGHGRMPFFMKIVWIAFLVFATWYTVTYLLTALGTETMG